MHRSRCKSPALPSSRTSTDEHGPARTPELSVNVRAGPCPSVQPGVSIPAMRWLRALLALLFALPAAAQDFPRGRFKTVVIQGNPSQSYVLYLPTAYRPDRKWPILYVLDARSNGAEAGQRFLAGAERYGFIVASSTNTLSKGGWARKRVASAS